MESLYNSSILIDIRVQYLRNIYWKRTKSLYDQMNKFIQ